MRILSTSLWMSLIAVLLLGLAAHAQDTTAIQRAWKISIETGLGVTQAAYSDNWTGGESGSIIWVSYFRGKAEKQLNPSLFFGNELKLEFGQTHTQVDSTKQWEKPKKSADKVRFDTILRLTKGWAVDPYTAGTLESQFVDMSGPKKIYFNSVDLTESVGVARDLFKVPDVRVLTTRLGLGLRQHLIHAAKTTNDGGIEWVTDLALGSANTKYSFVSKLTVFQALFNSQEDQLPNDYWQTADLNWDNALRANINSVLQMNLGWQLLYDKEIDLAGRFKETLSLGVAYKFANYE